MSGPTDLFAGPARPVPEAQEFPRRYAEYRPVSKIVTPPVVRHAEGYDGFVAVLNEHGYDAGADPCPLHRQYRGLDE